LKKKNHIGDKFGNLIVLEEAKSLKGKARWLCLCVSCDSKLLVTGDKLRNKGTKSCRACAAKTSWINRRNNIFSKKEEALSKEILKGKISLPPLGACLIPVVTAKIITDAIVDIEYKELVDNLQWHYLSGYATTSINNRLLSMHRMIAFSAGLVEELHPGKGGMEIDHINRNKLDNRVSNFREVTCSEQAANSYKSTNTSGAKGVYISPTGRFIAKITVRRKSMYLGTFDTLEEAKTAYEEAAEKYFDLPEGIKS
jgi:hypothetical protein